MGSVSKIARPLSAPVRAPASDVDRARIDADLAALEGLGVEELRLQWRNRWGRLAPARLSRSLLYRVMVYRMQAEAFGDLDRETKRMLDRLADHPSMVGASTAEPTERASAPASSSIGNVVPLVLKPGALLTREWQGRIERVMVLEEGFAWNGKTHASVSAVAFAITGVKWNGRRFFFGAADRGSGGGSGRRPRVGIPNTLSRPGEAADLQSPPIVGAAS